MRSVNTVSQGGAAGIAVAMQQRAGGLLSSAMLLRLAQWTAAAALVEFLLLRVAIRLGPMLPQQPAVLRAADAVILLGSTAMNVAALLTIGALWLAACRVSSHALRGLLAAAGILTLARVLAAHSDLIFLLYTAVALAAMLWLLASPALPFRRRVLLSALLAVYGLLAYPVAAASVERLGWRWPAAPGAFFVAEGLAVAVAWLAFLVFPARRNRWRMVAALALTTLAVGFWLSRPWLALTLSQWTVGFTGFLPIGLYFVALWLFTATVVGLATGRRAEVWGLLLVALAGLRWDYTYLSGLALLGFLALALPWPPSPDRNAEGA